MDQTEYEMDIDAATGEVNDYETEAHALIAAGSQITLSNYVAMMEERYDNLGRKVSESTLDINGNPVVRKWQKHQMYTITYEADGTRTYNYYYGDTLVKTEKK